MDLSEAIAGVEKTKDSDPEVTTTIASIKAYADSSSVDPASLAKMAKLEVFLKRWGRDNGIDAYGIQCWTSIQQNLGICGCTTMSRLADQNIPAACEADILGTLSMHACLLASGTPSALADWNNLHNDDDELVNVWHCGVFPKSFTDNQPKLSIHGIIVSSGAAPAANSQGIVELVARPSPLTLFRVTQDIDSGWKALVAQGNIEDNAAATSGSYGWCRIKNLQRLYRDVLLRHFPHHVAITQAHVGEALWEAFGNYLGFGVYHADQTSLGVYEDKPRFTGS
jgi:L-fucose isomerase-like protein